MYRVCCYIDNFTVRHVVTAAADTDEGWHKSHEAYVRLELGGTQNFKMVWYFIKYHYTVYK